MRTDQDISGFYYGQFIKPVTQLLYALIDVYNVTECFDKYKAFVTGDTEIFEINDSMLCGGNSKSDTCKGES